MSQMKGESAAELIYNTLSKFEVGEPEFQPSQHTALFRTQLVRKTELPLGPSGNETELQWV